MLTELEAYLASAAGLTGQVRPCHGPGCPAAEAWVPLIQCACRLRLAGGPAPGAQLAHPPRDRPLPRRSG